MVKKRGCHIETDIFYKSTDTHQYLDFRSCHPSHTKRNIPYCLAKRVCTIVDNPETKKLRLNELAVFLERRHYPKKLITRGIENANGIPQEELRRVKPKPEKDELISFVTTHNPRNIDVYRIAKENLPILHKSQRLKQLFPAEDILKSKRQPKNLKRLLTKAKFLSTAEIQETKVKKCGDSRCGTCAHLVTGNHIILKSGKRMFTNSDITCKSKNLIYCIICGHCKEFYIGQTGNTLCERVRIHRQQIRDPAVRQIPLSEHLDVCANGNFTVFPFYKVDSHSITKRLSKELRMIDLFNPKLNGHITLRH